ncbi:MAG: MGMT family protein [Candidatus Buchananbacteria bacterium]|nr:MGMT family protein [Candidatus Buchananbacteria bacterium]
MPTRTQISKSGLTQFQIAVLQKLQSVPRGRVTTYQYLARAIGRPRAVRAVGNALNANPWIISVPCHRVVRNNGEIGGYARGAKRKALVLKNEGIMTRQGKIVDFEKKLYRFG